MKKVNSDELRKEYSRKNFGKGVRGKHYKEYIEGTNLVLLSPDVASAFPNDKAVNDALRRLITIAQDSVALTKH